MGRPLQTRWAVSGVIEAPTEKVKKRHSIAIQGEWWYRGVHQVEPHERGSLLTYRVHNIAPGASRWLVPLMQRRLGTQMKNNLQGLLHTISDRLGCTTSLITE